MNGKQRSFLRALAHHLDPVVQIGKFGLSEAVVAQLAEQLRAHELIKVRFGREAPQGPQEAAAGLASATQSELIQIAGRTLTIYRRHDHNPKIELPGRPPRTTGPAKARRGDPRRSLRGKQGPREETDRASGTVRQRPKTTLTKTSAKPVGERTRPPAGKKKPSTKGTARPALRRSKATRGTGTSRGRTSRRTTED